MNQIHNTIAYIYYTLGKHADSQNVNHLYQIMDKNYLKKTIGKKTLLVYLKDFRRTIGKVPYDIAMQDKCKKAYEKAQEDKAFYN